MYFRIIFNDHYGNKQDISTWIVNIIDISAIENMDVSSLIYQRCIQTQLSKITLNAKSFGMLLLLQCQHCAVNTFYKSKRVYDPIPII